MNNFPIEIKNNIYNWIREFIEIESRIYWYNIYNDCILYRSKNKLFYQINQHIKEFSINCDYYNSFNHEKYISFKDWMLIYSKKYKGIILTDFELHKYMNLSKEEYSFKKLDIKFNYIL